MSLQDTHSCITALPAADLCLPWARSLSAGGCRLCVELLILFCPRVYAKQGILLEYCDKPSIFQAIGH